MGYPYNVIRSTSQIHKLYNIYIHTNTYSECTHITYVTHTM